MRRFLSTLAASCALSACTTGGTETPPASVTAAPPANYRATVASEVRESFFDPYSIRDASISRPLYATGIYDGVTPFPSSGWIVCVRANAKNRMGAFIGRQFSVMLFEGDRITKVLSGPSFQGQADQHCRNASMEPFPEIEAQT